MALDVALLQDAVPDVVFQQHQVDGTELCSDVVVGEDFPSILDPAEDVDDTLVLDAGPEEVLDDAVLDRLVRQTEIEVKSFVAPHREDPGAAGEGPPGSPGRGALH